MSDVGGRTPLALVGSTASGKSELAMALARRLGDVEIVMVDSMAVYRGMDIGTAKPTPRERAEVPHHLIDLVEPSCPFTVADFQAAAQRAPGEIAARGRRPLLVAGTGLYLRAVIDGLDLPGRYDDVRAHLEAEPDTAALHRRLAEVDPRAASRIEAANRRRIVRALEVCLGSGRPFSSFGPGLDAYPPVPYRQVGLSWPRTVLDERIRHRYRLQLDAGFVEEVRALLARPGGLSHTARQALGYRELIDHVEAATPLCACVDLAVRRTRRFARRQERWFRRDPRITWLTVREDPIELLETLEAQWA